MMKKSIKKSMLLGSALLCGSMLLGVNANADSTRDQIQQQGQAQMSQTWNQYQQAEQAKASTTDADSQTFQQNDTKARALLFEYEHEGTQLSNQLHEYDVQHATPDPQAQPNQSANQGSRTPQSNAQSAQNGSQSTLSSQPNNSPQQAQNGSEAPQKANKANQNNPVDDNITDQDVLAHFNTVTGYPTVNDKYNYQVTKESDGNYTITVNQDMGSYEHLVSIYSYNPSMNWVHKLFGETLNNQVGLNQLAVWTDNAGMIHHVNSNGLDTIYNPKTHETAYLDFEGSLPENAEIKPVKQSQQYYHQVGPITWASEDGNSIITNPDADKPLIYPWGKTSAKDNYAYVVITCPDGTIRLLKVLPDQPGSDYPHVKMNIGPGSSFYPYKNYHWVQAPDGSWLFQAPIEDQPTKDKVIPNQPVQGTPQGLTDAQMYGSAIHSGTTIITQNSQNNQNDAQKYGNEIQGGTTVMTREQYKAQQNANKHPQGNGLFIQDNSTSQGSELPQTGNDSKSGLVGLGLASVGMMFGLGLKKKQVK